MISSMTAFSRLHSDHSWGSLILEIRSVNRRYLDTTFTLPDSLRGLEPKWRQKIRKVLSRGKVELHLRLPSDDQTQEVFAVNEVLLDQVISAAAKLQQKLHGDSSINPLELLRWPGVLDEAEVSSNKVEQEASKLLRCCLDALHENRQREGLKLKQIVDERLQNIDIIIADTRSRLPEILKQQRQRLISRLAELQVELDTQRLGQELVYIAQKSDVDEELDRLDTHLFEVERTLKKGGPCGRRLDFMMQELNREANTLSSTSISSETTQNAVELKVLIEQMREQIQNIE
jgi:uncharacterized protein (TIGR00255 family)